MTGPTKNICTACNAEWESVHFCPVIPTYRPTTTIVDGLASTVDRYEQGRQSRDAQIEALISVLRQWNKQFENLGIRQKTWGDAECSVIEVHHDAIFESEALYACARCDIPLNSTERVVCADCEMGS